jgi:uncharacterized membrane protein YoaK (UPF0700 family)
VLLFVLALCAGYVDAVSFFAAGVFTANMTGNTVLLAGAVASRWWRHLPGTIGWAAPLLSIAAFLLGAAIATTVLRARPPQTRFRRVMLLFVGAVLAACALGWHAVPILVIVALLSAVMGVQSVVAVRLGMHGVSTTYVTGTLVTAMLALFGVRTAARVRAGISDLAVWALYLGGAVAGAAGEAMFGTRSLWIVAAVVLLSAAVL